MYDSGPVLTICSIWFKINKKKHSHFSHSILWYILYDFVE